MINSFYIPIFLGLKRVSFFFPILSDKEYPSCLLAHLRCCHPRFRFSASWQREIPQLVLEVTLDETYDGSNDCAPLRAYRPTTKVTPESGVDIGVPETSASRNPNQFPLVGGWTGYLSTTDYALMELRKNATMRFLQRRYRQPLKRLPFSQLIYWGGVERFSRGNREHQLHNGNSGEGVSTSAAVAGPLEVGHRRTYFHTATLQPIEPEAFEDSDSEEEDAPLWLRDHYQRKVEEFTDVNQGEKELMQIWNAFLLSIKPSEVVVCDGQIGNLLLTFVQRFGERLHKRGLRRNFILHLANLYDYGLLAPSLMRRVVCAFDELKTAAAAAAVTTSSSSSSSSSASS